MDCKKKKHVTTVATVLLLKHDHFSLKCYITIFTTAKRVETSMPFPPVLYYNYYIVYPLTVFER